MGGLSIIINSFNALPLYCDRVFKGARRLSKESVNAGSFFIDFYKLKEKTGNKIIFYENSSDNFIKVVNEILI